MNYLIDLPPPSVLAWCDCGPWWSNPIMGMGGAPMPCMVPAMLGMNDPKYMRPGSGNPAGWCCGCRGWYGGCPPHAAADDTCGECGDGLLLLSVSPSSSWMAKGDRWGGPLGRGGSMPRCGWPRAGRCWWGSPPPPCRRFMTDTMSRP